MPEEFPTDDDAIVLKMLSDGGNDMAREMLIEFEVTVDTEENADEIADRAENAGFQSHVFFDNESPAKEDAPEPSWKCVCAKSLVPTQAQIRQAKMDIDAIARKSNGQFESWGTFGNVKKPS